MSFLVYFLLISSHLFKFHLFSSRLLFLSHLFFASCIIFFSSSLFVPFSSIIFFFSLVSSHLFSSLFLLSFNIFSFSLIFLLLISLLFHPFITFLFFSQLVSSCFPSHLFCLTVVITLSFTRLPALLNGAVRCGSCGVVPYTSSLKRSFVQECLPDLCLFVCFCG